MSAHNSAWSVVDTNARLGRHLLSEHATSIVIDSLQGDPANVLHLLLEICAEYQAISEVSQSSHDTRASLMAIRYAVTTLRSAAGQSRIGF